MKISGLSSLYKAMLQGGERRCKLQYVHGRVVFNVIFLIDEKPFSLMFGAKGHNVAFEFSVGTGFNVDPVIPKEQYRALCQALGLTYDRANPFSIKSFLEAFSNQIPGLVGSRQMVRPHEISVHRSDFEESEKIYFSGWRDNTVRGENVTLRNLHKTRRLLGEATYESCKKRNISTCWTTNPGNEIEVDTTDPLS